MPGPWVLRMILVAVCAMVLAGAGAAWHMSQVSGQEAMRRVVAQQTDEVEVIARLLASKMEQSQKVLRTMAAGVTPRMQDSSFFDDQRQYLALPALGFFDAVQVVGSDGAMLLNLRGAGLWPQPHWSLPNAMCCGAPWPMESPRYRSWWPAEQATPG